MIHPPRTLMEVFNGLPEETLVQLIENELITSPAPKDIHQKILTKLVAALYNLEDQNKLGEVRCASYDVFLDNRNAFQPDIIFISNENVDKIKEDGIYGAPDLIIKILSPGTAQYDKVKKKAVYERNAVKGGIIFGQREVYAAGKNQFPNTVKPVSHTVYFLIIK